MNELILIMSNLSYLILPYPELQQCVHTILIYIYHDESVIFVKELLSQFKISLTDTERKT